MQEVNFTGGEPLIRSDWYPIADRLHKLGITTKVLTNGLHLDPDMLDKLHEVGVAGIGVSIDGLEQTHDYIRGYEGLYEKVLRGIRRTLDAGFDVTVITTANGLNIEELPQMLQELHETGVKRWQVQPVFMLGRGKTTPELRLTKDSYLRLGEFVRDWRPKAAGLGLDILPGDSFGYYTAYDDRQPPWRGCPAGLFSCGITSDGKVKGCLSLPDPFIEGDLRTRDLWDIWFDPGSFTYTRQFNCDDLGANCRTCTHAEQCRGGCTAMSYGVTKQVHNDPFCFYGIENGFPIAITESQEATTAPLAA